MNSAAKPLRWNRLSSSSLSRSRVISSSAPNGSSNRKTFGLHHQRAGQRAAHLHAARQLLRVLLLEAVEPDEGDVLGGATRSLRLVDALQLGEQLDVASAPCATAAASRPGTRSRRWPRSTRDEPPVALVRPEAIRSSVLLPQPDGPTTVTNSPGRTSNVVSRRAWVPSGKTIETSLKLNAGAAPTSPIGATVAASGDASEIPVVLNASPCHRSRSSPDRCSTRPRRRPGTPPCWRRRRARRAGRAATSPTTRATISSVRVAAPISVST